MDEQAIFAAVTEHTGVPEEKLERVFSIEDEVVKLSMNHTALGKSTADKARATALLIIVLRKIGMQADTPIELIRAECQRKLFCDGPNFSRHMSGVEGCVTKGEGKNKRFEPRTAGITAFPTLIDKVLGES